MGTGAIIKYKPIEGQVTFIADGLLDFTDIVHNAGYNPQPTITAVTPISLNHLNRTLSWPNTNTIRITFTTPPVVGEDITYLWSVPPKA